MLVRHFSMLQTPGRIGGEFCVKKTTDSMFRRYNISTADEHREALARTVELRRQRATAEKAAKVIPMQRGAA